MAEKAAKTAARRARKAADQARHRERNRAVTVTAPSPTVQPKKESKALTKARERLELAKAAGASPASIAIIERRIEKLTPKNRKPKPEDMYGTAPYISQTPSPADMSQPSMQTELPEHREVRDLQWTPETAATAVSAIVQGEFDKGRSAAEIQSMMWAQMTTLSPSKDRVLFTALQAAMREFEAYR